MAIFPGSAIPSAASTGYEIDNSLRFNDPDSPDLHWTPGSDGDRKTWTFSVWVKKSKINNNGAIFSAWGGGSNQDELTFRGSGDPYISLEVYNLTSRGRAHTEMLFRDPSAWYHIVWVWDTTEAAAADRSIVYINGVKQAIRSATLISPDADALSEINSAAPHYLGQQGDSSAYLSSYLADAYFIDGTAYAASDFGELDSDTNQWKPKDAKDDLTFGTNGFYQKYGGTEDANVFADSADKNGIPVEGVHTDTSEKKFGTASAQFSGTDEELLIPESPDWQFGTQDFTIEMFMRRTSADMNPFYIAGSSSEYFRFNTYGVDDINVRLPNGIADFSAITSGGPEADTWHHVALVREGTTFTMYCNGSRIGSTVTSSVSCDTSGPIIFGSDGSSSWWIGYLDEIRVSVGIARYSGASYTIPTEAFTTDSYTKLLLHCDGADDGTVFTDSSDSAKRHTITANGDVTNTRAVRKVGDSSIKFDGTGDYLITSDSSDWDFGTENWTIEFWVRFSGGLGAAQRVVNFAELTTPPIGGMIETGADNKMVYYEYTLNSDWTKWCYDTNAYVLDTWYHYAVVRQGSDFRMYRDGVEQESDGTSSASLASAHGPYIGTNRGVAGWLTGYMDEIRISDSARYPDGTTFTPQTTEFTADANTKLLIHSNWDGGLGADSSGNYNTFTATNLVATDQMIDTPTNNFATLNPIRKSVSAMTISEGNLQWSGVDTAYTNLVGTIPMMSGKWYFEIYNIQVDSGGWVSSKVGVLSVKSQAEIQGETHDAKGTLWYDADGKVWCGNGTGSADSFTYGNTYTDGDIIGIAVNMTDSQVTFYKNNTAQDSGTPFDFSNMTQPYGIDDGTLPWVGGLYSADSQVINFGQDSSFAGNKTAQGNQDGNSKGDFYYAPPTDYLALCTDNLSDPEIALPGSHFQSVLYTGTGVNPHAITGVGFQPDLVWTKARTKGAGNGGNPWVTDAIRGVTKELKTDGTEAEATDLNGVVAFGADGFSVGTGGFNYLDDLFVGWNWKAGGAGVSNGTGSITSTVSANTTAGFSIVSYTGDDASSATIGHGLSVAPELIIIKSRDSAEGWYVGSSVGTMSFTSSDYLTLNTTGGESSSSTIWDDTAPTSTLFTVGTNDAVNNTDDFIAYCFHSVEGYSKVGSYEGNNNVDGSFVYCGFKPTLLLIKNIDSAGNNWLIFDDKRDTYNMVTQTLFPDVSDAEATASTGFDFVSNGFKARSSAANKNQAYTYLYYAIAESPFKTSNAR